VSPSIDKAGGNIDHQDNERRTREKELAQNGGDPHLREDTLGPDTVSRTERIFKTWEKIDSSRGG